MKYYYIKGFYNYKISEDRTDVINVTTGKHLKISANGTVALRYSGNTYRRKLETLEITNLDGDALMIAQQTYKQPEDNRKYKKLNKEQKEYIRKYYEPYSKDYNTQALAEKFKVSKTAIYKVIKNKNENLSSE